MQCMYVWLQFIYVCNVFMYVSMYACKHVMSVCMRVYIYVSMYVCMYVM